MNTIHLLQIAFASLGVVTAFIIIVGFIMRWRFAVAWAGLGDLLIYGVCGMLFGLAMAGGVVSLLAFVAHLFVARGLIVLCLPGTTTCAHTLSADLTDLVARVFLTGSALACALGAMRLRLSEGDAATSSKEQVQR